MSALLLTLIVAAAPPPPYVVVLGVAQDAGHPQAGTKDPEAWRPERRRRVSCLGLVDPTTGRRWLFDATPDLPRQLFELDRIAPNDGRPGLAGIFLTHGHIGHYTGLMYLGREAIGAKDVPVYAMPRMKAFLRDNGPWDQLVSLKNISLRRLAPGKAVRLGPKLAVEPFEVPHRDEYTETVGFVISGPKRKVAYLPDIDKWARWQARGGLEGLLREVDVAYVDGTFFADGEIPGRAMAEIPHPFVTETLERLRKLPPKTRRKVRFIHLNRTNPALWPGPARRRIEAAGARVAAPLEREAL